MVTKSRINAILGAYTKVHQDKKITMFLDRRFGGSSSAQNTRFNPNPSPISTSSDLLEIKKDTPDKENETALEKDASRRCVAETGCQADILICALYPVIKIKNSRTVTYFYLKLAGLTILIIKHFYNN